VNHSENKSCGERGLMAIKSFSFFVSQESRSTPRRGNDPMLGLWNQSRKNSRSYFRGCSSLARETCFNSKSSGKIKLCSWIQLECYLRRELTVKIQLSAELRKHSPLLCVLPFASLTQGPPIFRMIDPVLVSRVSFCQLLDFILKVCNFSL